MIERYEGNPLITPADVRPSRPDFEVMCAFNAGATLYGDKTILLVRVAERPVPEDGYVSTAYVDLDRLGEHKTLRLRLDDPDLELGGPCVFLYGGQPYLTSVSHLRVAVSEDGRRFEVAERPALQPEYPHEVFGIEDARITFLEGHYYINYSAIAPEGITTCLARTTDFVTFEKLGIIFPPDNKDVALFPERIGGRYYCFHRPSMKQIGPPSMWLASSDNLLDWGRHRYLMGPRPGNWDTERVGCGAQPIKTADGWLQIYHGADHAECYGSDAVLLDLEEPWRIIARGNGPLLRAEAPYEREGIHANIVFHNGLVERDDGTADLYYGGADTVTCCAVMDVQAVLDWLLRR